MFDTILQYMNNHSIGILLGCVLAVWTFGFLALGLCATQLGMEPFDA